MILEFKTVRINNIQNTAGFLLNFILAVNAFIIYLFTDIAIFVLAKFMYKSMYKPIP